MVKLCHEKTLLFAYAQITFVFAIDSTTPLLSKSQMNFKPPAIFCGCTARFVSDLVRNPEDRFSCDALSMNAEEFLFQWLRALPTSRQSFNTIFGDCPYCEKVGMKGLRMVAVG